MQKPRFLEMPALLTCTVSYFYGGYIIATTGFLASQLLSLCIFKSLPTFDLANFWSPLKVLNWNAFKCCYRYRTHAIISHYLYIFYPNFEAHFFVFKEVFLENFVLMYGLYSRAVCNQERVIMARVRYLTRFFWNVDLKIIFFKQKQDFVIFI